MLPRSVYITLHIIGCLLFLSLPFLLSPVEGDISDLLHNPFIQRDAITYSLCVIFFYVSYYYLIPEFYFKQRYVIFLFLLAISMAIVIYIPRLLIDIDVAEYFQFTNKLPPKSFFFEVRFHFFLFVGIFFGSLALKLNDRWKKSQREKLISELSYLKAQINPHFLFNTLNSIYSLALEKSDHTATAIVKLSGMMRYATSDTSKDFVSLEKEINYINSYIELQKLRLGETAIINYSVDGDISDKEIAPLVLIPFIENAFKHGVNPEETSQIDIQISVSDINLYLHVFNLKVPHNMQTQLKTGFGLENGRSQLKLLYPNRHTIKIENKNLSFTVSIKINLL